MARAHSSGPTRSAGLRRIARAIQYSLAGLRHAVTNETAVLVVVLMAGLSWTVIAGPILVAWIRA